MVVTTAVSYKRYIKQKKQKKLYNKSCVLFIYILTLYLYIFLIFYFWIFFFFCGIFCFCFFLGVGTYRDPSVYECKACTVGTYSSDAGTETACPGCPMGRYGPTVIAPCVYCPSGQVQSTIGSPSGTAPEVCTNCQNGQHSVATTSSNTGASECQECTRGQFQDHSDRNTGSTSSHTCNVCGKGQYQNQNNQEACINCNKGRFQPSGQTSSQSISCKSCSILGNTKYQDTEVSEKQKMFFLKKTNFWKKVQKSIHCCHLIAL